MINAHPLTRRHMLTLAAAAGAAACAPQENGGGALAHTSPKGCWNAQPALPFAVQEIYPAAHKGRIHVAGGLLGENGRVVGVSDRHVAYDPATGTATQMPALPTPRHHPHLVSHDGKLYALGGFTTLAGAVAWIMTGETLVYDEGANTWAPLSSAPEPHAEVVAASIGDRIHVVGGRRNTGAANLGYGDHTDSDSHFVFTPSSASWERAAPALPARNSAAGAVIGGQWHVAGGRSVTGGPTNAHEVYDQREDRWRNAAPMPAGSGAGGNAAVTLGGALYVFGGEVFGQDGGKVHPEVWRYDPKSDAWEAAAPMPTPRHGLGAVVIGDAGYLVGGAIRPSGNGTSDAVERFTLACG
jgi:hypothetical protein